MIRWSITGTTTSAVHPSAAMPSSASAGSNRRRQTTAEPNPTARRVVAKPSAWNIGAAMYAGSPARNGTIESTAPSGASELGCSRGAPFGVPVVPLVSITTEALSSGSAAPPDRRRR